MKAKCIALQHKVPKEHAASSSDNTQKLVHWSPELVTESTFTSSPHKPRSNPYFSSSSSFSQPPTTFMETVVTVRNVLGRWGKKAAEATKKAESLAGNAWQHYNFSERVELQEFSQGSCPPSLALQGMLWSTIGDQLLASPILDGKALLYSFISTPEVRIGVAFGSNGSQSLPATEWPVIESSIHRQTGKTYNIQSFEQVKVKYGSSYHQIQISSHASFGELKKMLTEPTGLHVQDRKLIYKKKERDSKSYLDVERVKDGSKLVLLVDIESRKRRLLEMLKIAKKEKTLKSLTEIKVEVDKLAKKIQAGHSCWSSRALRH
eukprot:XP_014634642.1 uncharacterized protein LOC102667143 isoform X1 [Glycine max]